MEGTTYGRYNVWKVQRMEGTTYGTPSYLLSVKAVAAEYSVPSQGRSQASPMSGEWGSVAERSKALV